MNTIHTSTLSTCTPITPNLVIDNRINLDEQKEATTDVLLSSEVEEGQEILNPLSSSSDEIKAWYTYIKKLNAQFTVPITPIEYNSGFVIRDDTAYILGNPLNLAQNLYLDISSSAETVNEIMLPKISDNLNLSNVASLDISGHNITEIPNSIVMLKSLEKLNARGNQLTSLPQSINNLSWLKSLDLGQNSFTYLPESIGSLSNLQELDISNNQLITLPESIQYLTDLAHLNISYNQLSSMPESINVLPKLEYLDMSFNMLYELPESLGNLNTLEILDMSHNEFFRLPESIGNLSSLRELTVQYTNLTDLPESIGNLSNLQKLHLGFNRLHKELPASIGNLSNLQELGIKSNFLTGELPQSMSNLSKLEFLDVDNNNLTGPMPSFSQNLTIHAWGNTGMQVGGTQGTNPEAREHAKEYFEALGLGHLIYDNGIEFGIHFTEDTLPTLIEGSTTALSHYATGSQVDFNNDGKPDGWIYIEHGPFYPELGLFDRRNDGPVILLSPTQEYQPQSFIPVSFPKPTETEATVHFWDQWDPDSRQWNDQGELESTTITKLRVKITLEEKGGEQVIIHTVEDGILPIAWFGNSGSPLVNDQGKIIGILAMGHGLWGQTYFEYQNNNRIGHSEAPE